MDLAAFLVKRRRAQECALRDELQAVPFQRPQSQSTAVDDSRPHMDGGRTAVVCVVSMDRTCPCETGLGPARTSTANFRQVRLPSSIRESVHKGIVVLSKLAVRPYSSRA